MGIGALRRHYEQNNILEPKEVELKQEPEKEPEIEKEVEEVKKQAKPKKSKRK